MKNKFIRVITSTLLCGTFSCHVCNATDPWGDMRRSLLEAHPMPTATIPSTSDFGIETLESKIKTTETQVQARLREEVGNPTRVLVLGTTGSGKSTLVHGLSGKKLTAEEGIGSYRINVVGGVLPGFTIGHHLDSATTIPVSWYDRASNLVYWDCPGFMDSRGERQEIINAFAVDQLFTAPSRIGIVLTIQESDFEGARGMEVIKRFNKIISLLPDQDQLKRALSLVVTKKIDARFTSHEKLMGLLERAKKAKDVSQIEKAIDLLTFVVENPDRIFTFPEPRGKGEYNDFSDRRKLIDHLGGASVINPEHAFQLDDNVKILMFEMMNKFANVPSMVFELEDAMHLDYRGKDLSCLKAWKKFADILLAKLHSINSPDKLSSEIAKSLPSLHNASVFKPLLDRLASSQRYINFAKKVEPGCAGQLDIPVIEEILPPILKNMQSELGVLIESKEFLKRQEEASKALEAKLNEEVRSGALLRADADKQIRDLQKKAQEERNKADTELASLKSKIDNARSEAERDRRNALAAQERMYDSRISDLERQLRNSSDQSALISRLQSRVEELESQLQRSQQIGFQGPFGPFGPFGGGGNLRFVPGLGWVNFG